MNAHSLKLHIARASDALGITRWAHRAQVASHAPFIRAINYHGFPPDSVEVFASHLRYFGEEYQPVGLGELRAFLNGEWIPEGKPGLVVTFDDGLRSQFEIAAPLLEKYGFPGWFFVPTELLDVPDDLQRNAAADHQVLTDSEPTGARVFMTWEEVRALRKNHVIGCHTASHHRLTAETTPDQLVGEIAGAKQRMEEMLDEEAEVFCWVGGEEYSYSRAAAEAIVAAGFRLSFQTNHAPIRARTDPHQLQRSNVEATDPLWLARFQTSGIMDLLYTSKRRRINRLTHVPESSEMASSGQTAQLTQVIPSRIPPKTASPPEVTT